jgi:hypothetical protein
MTREQIKATEQLKQKESAQNGNKVENGINKEPAKAKRVRISDRREHGTHRTPQYIMGDTPITCWSLLAPLSLSRIRLRPNPIGT